MLPGTGGQTTRTCAKDSNVAKLEENRRVYWLTGSAAESTDGAPLSMKFRVARLVIEATTDSETDFDVNATQLEESEETRRLKHDARQVAHLQSRSRSGETMDPAHRPQASTHEGEDRRGKDHHFSFVWSREQRFQLCRKTEPKPDWWAHVEHSDQLTGLC